MPTDCISEQTMFDYIDNKLSPKEQHVVEKHLLDCELCSDAMDGLRLVKNRGIIGTINQQVSERMAMPLVAKKSSGFNYKVIMSVAAGLLLLMGGIFFFNNLSPSAEEKASVADLKTPQKEVQLNNKVAPAADSTETSSATVITKDNATAATYDQSPATPLLKEEDAQQEKPVQETAPDELQKATDDETTVKTIALEGAAKSATGKNAKLADSLSLALNGTVATGSTYEWSSADTKKDDDNAAGAGSAVPQKDESKNQATTYAVVTEQLRDEDKAEKTKVKKAPEEKKASERAADYKATPSSTAQSPAYAPPDLAQNNENTIKADSTRTVAGMSYNASITPAVDQLPEFPGGNPALLKFISTNAKWPALAMDKSVAATKILVQFTIDKNGNVKNPKILKGINAECDKEALRLVALMPKWKPATSGGKNIAYIHSMLILVDQKLNAK